MSQYRPSKEDSFGIYGVFYSKISTTQWLGVWSQQKLDENIKMSIFAVGYRVLFN